MSRSVEDIALEKKRDLINGDRDAYAWLFRTYHAALLRYARRLSGSEDAAYDILQDVFMKVWDVRETLEPDGAIAPFLYTMTRNRALSVLRKETRSSPLDDLVTEPVASESGAEKMEERDLKARMKRWLQSLPERRREAFELSRVHGLTHHEIGRVMQVSERTVDAHIMQALKYLRMQLEHYRAEVGA